MNKEKKSRICPFCQESFDSNTLKSHINIEHLLENKEPRDTSTVCDHCGKKFPANSLLIRHVEGVHEKVKLQCDLCGKLFSQKQHLNDHVEEVHQDDQDKQYICEHCCKAFGVKSKLNWHIETVHGKKKLECKFCKKLFAPGSLSRHISSVHNKVKFKCEVCGKSFTQKCHLQYHMKTQHK